MKRSITATFEIVTPMFLGGADQHASRIRESSIKGALAFWWRALNYAKFVEEADGNQSVALKAMQKKEQALFGSDKGQGVFLLKVSNQSNGSVRRKQEKLFEKGNQVVGAGACYMGYGLMGAIGGNAGALERSCLVDGKFQLRLIFKPSESARMEEIIQALKLFGLLGGLGSRVRRGWGSVALVELADCTQKDSPFWNAPVSKTEYIEQLNNIFSSSDIVVGLKQSGENWPVTAFSSRSRCFVTIAEKSCALTTLNEVGEKFQIYRAWGYSANGTKEPIVNGKKSLKNFEDDHHWFREPEFRNSHCEFVPERTAFGLPHNYNTNWGVAGDGDIDRRASPLMFHIHRTNAVTFAVLLFLPNQFLPTNSVHVAGTGKNYNFHNEGLPVIENFLAGGHINRRISDVSDKKGSAASTLKEIFLSVDAS